MPWWLAPSGPVTPARSSTKVTPARCSATSMSDLVEGAVEERGVHGDDRVQPGEGEAGRAGDRVLLGDADVEDPVGELGGEAVQTGGDHHRRGDGDDVVAAAADPSTSSSANSEVHERPRAGTGDAGLGVDHADGVELVGLVGDRRRVALALAS